MNKALFSLFVLVLAPLFIVSGCREEKETKLGLESLESIATIKEEVAAPQNLTCQAGDNQVVLGWDEPDGEAVTGYVIYRWAQGGTPAVLRELPASITSFTDASVANGTRYFYLVVCRNSSRVACAVEAQAVAEPVAPPPPPPPISVEETDHWESDESQYAAPESPSPPATPPASPNPPPGCDDPPPGGGG